MRHYQHLATRMSGPRVELRTWRAWVCLHLAEGVLSGGEYRRDEEQILREGVVVPEPEEVLQKLDTLGLSGEGKIWSGVL